MKKGIRLRKLYRGTCFCIVREAFEAGNAKLIVEDMINIFAPWRSTRIMRIAGTNAFYSEVPISYSRHELLCYNFCEEALRSRETSFYRHALILGCGGGAIPRWLLQEYPLVFVDVVDYSPEIIDVSKRYFLKKWAGSDRLYFYCTDAQIFEPPGYKYDFIFCDLFDGDDLVPFVYDKRFAKKLRGMLNDEGVLVINCGWKEHLNEINSVYQSLFEYTQVPEEEARLTNAIVVSNAAL